MNKSIKSTGAPISKRLIAMTLDLLALVLSTVAVFFIGLFAFTNTLTNYPENKELIANKKEALNLNLGKGLNYLEYDTALKGFYMTYEDEIVDLYSKRYERDMTLNHIFNVNVYGLPVEPNLQTHESDYFTYRQNETTSSYDPNMLGIVKPGEHNEKFYEDLNTYLRVKYDALENLLVTVDKDFGLAVDQNILMESITRMVSFGITIIIFYVVIPLCNKDGTTLFERFYGFAHVNYRDGYKAKWWKTILRPIIFLGLTYICIATSVNFKVVILSIAPLFISYLLLIFTKTNRTLDEFILSTMTVSKDESLIFKNKKEEQDYENSDEYKVLEDEDFLDKLSSVETFNLGESRSEELDKDTKKEE